jgi:subtilase family serine protease
MKWTTTIVDRIQHGCAFGLAALTAGTLSCSNASAANIKIASDLPQALSNSVAISHVDSTKAMNIVFVLQSKNPLGAAEFARRVSSPDDPLYGKFLSAEQFGEAYGPSDAAYSALETWVKKNGLIVNEPSRSRTTLSVHGSATQFEAMFGTRINTYRGPDGRSFFSAESEPALPVEVAASIKGIVGLSSYTQHVPLFVRKPTQSSVAALPVMHPESAGGSGPGGAYNARDLRMAYDIPTQLRQGNLETIAVFEQGGFDPLDIVQYETANRLGATPVKVRNVNGYGGAIDDPNVELEAVLDIDMVIGINPAVKQVLVYEDGDDPFGVALLDALADMANDDSAQVISISYGTDEAIQGTAQIAAEGLLFQQLAAQGQTVLVSSGDQGAYGRSGTGLKVSDPGAQPYVTSVGGTSLYTGPGGVYEAEEVWNLLGAGLGATGGGVSSYWSIPSYQSRTLYPLPPPIFAASAAAVSVATANGGSATMRNIPDVAAVADPLTGVAVYSALNGGWIQIGGTSASAPIWAGYFSIINSARQKIGLPNLGFANPYLYYLALTSISFVDIRDGSNGNASLYGIPGYSAGRGFDNCTGWGSMMGENLAFHSLTQHLVIYGNKPTAPKGLSGIPSTTTADVSWSASTGATGYIIQTTRLDTGTVTNYVSKSPQIVLTGLTSQKSYFIDVYSVNSNGAARAGFYLTTK